MSVELPRRELSAVEPSPGVREALDAARRAAPSPERLAASRQALLLRAGAIQPTPAGTTPQGADAASATHASGATRGVTAGLKVGTGALGKMLLVALGGAAVSAAVVWQLTSIGPREVTSPASRPPIDVQALSAPETALKPPSALQQPPMSPEPPRRVSPAVEDVAPDKPRTRRRPAARRIRHVRPIKPAPTAPVAPEPSTSGSSLRREVSLLSLARDALQDRPAETLRLAAEHARLFPSGRFVQEREVLAVHALLRRGQRDEAIERGERFLTLYPKSTHAQRVASLLQGAQ